MNSLYPTKPIRGVFGKVKLVDPCGICYDEYNQHIIVSDQPILLFDSITYQYNSIIKSKKNQPNEYIHPYGLCIQPFTHCLLVCDSWGNCIQVFNSDYTFLYQIGYMRIDFGNQKQNGQFHCPRGICCDEKGHILVADTGNHRIQEFNELGRFLHLFGSQGSALNQFIFPVDLCYNKQYHQLLVAVCNTQRVSLWSHDSCSKPQCISQIQLNVYCNSVCVDPLRNHQILIGTSCNVLVYDSRNHKEPIQILGSNNKGSELGEFDFVSGLCVNEQDGTLIICDRNNHRIQLF